MGPPHGSEIVGEGGVHQNGYPVAAPAGGAGGAAAAAAAAAAASAVLFRAAVSARTRRSLCATNAAGSIEACTVAAARAPSEKYKYKYKIYL
jgi:hypothetical protein